MTDRIDVAGLQIARELHAFVADEALPGTGIDGAAFWQAFSAIVHELAPKNRALLARREALQDEIDHWHRENGAPSDLAAYKAFLREIGYLVPEGPAFQVTTANVDPEIAELAGPQLVVPGDERALRAECRQCALGLALRRALRHRRHPRDGRRGARARATIRSAARRSSPGRATSSTRRCRSTAPAGATPELCRCRCQAWRSRLPTVARPA